MTDKYNGWTNYETWNVKLWMDNDQGSYDYWRETAQSMIGVSNQREYDLACELEHQFNESNPLGDDASTFSDLLGAALSSVNWHEISESLFDDLGE